jgi:hypothetical protein
MRLSPNSASKNVLLSSYPDVFGHWANSLQEQEKQVRYRARTVHL